jgi:hypothetical protein
MRTSTRSVRRVALGVALACVMLTETSCQRPAAPRSPRPVQPVGGGAAARNPREREETRRLVAEYSRRLDAKDLLSSANAPMMAVTVALRAVKTDPQNAAAYSLLGRGLLEEARFGEAAAAFRSTLKLDPRDRMAAQGLAESLRLAELAHSLPLRLKPRQDLLALIEVDRGSHAGVFVLIGSRTQLEDRSWYVDPEARLFVSERNYYRETFRTTHVAWENVEEIDYCRVRVADLLKMGSSQVILVSGKMGVDHFREALDVFLPQGDSLRRIAHVAGTVPSGNPPFEVKDLDADGRPEIEVSQLVEYALADGAIWRDVFAYDGRYYTLATSRFLDIVRDNVTELESRRKFYLQEFGHDDDRILEYLARGRRYLRDSEKAPLTTIRRQR